MDGLERYRLIMSGMISDMHMIDTYHCDMNGVCWVMHGDECKFHQSPLNDRLIHVIFAVACMSCHDDVHEKTFSISS
jgi:hypothetical protein